MDTDDFGNRMKEYEAQETNRYFLPLLPIYARLDGRSFHTFTKGMIRPYDHKFSSVMDDVTKFMVEETHATIGYTQSDEISLCWITRDYKAEPFFNRRIFKMASVLAGLASAKFNQIAVQFWEEKVKNLVPCFDCRVYNLPTQIEAMNCFLWREQDATKNAISMAAQHYFSHRDLQNKNGKEMQEMLFKGGVNFNDYPSRYKRGAYFRRVKFETPLDEETRLRIPESKRPEPGYKVIRSEVRRLELPPLTKIQNRVEVLFDGVEPLLLADAPVI